MAIVDKEDLMLHIVVEVHWIRRNAKAFRSASMLDRDDDYDDDRGPVSWESPASYAHDPEPAPVISDGHVRRELPPLRSIWYIRT